MNLDPEIHKTHSQISAISYNAADTITSIEKLNNQSKILLAKNNLANSQKRTTITLGKQEYKISDYKKTLLTIQNLDKEVRKMERYNLEQFECYEMDTEETSDPNQKSARKSIKITRKPKIPSLFQILPTLYEPRSVLSLSKKHSKNFGKVGNSRQKSLAKYRQSRSFFSVSNEKFIIIMMLLSLLLLIILIFIWGPFVGILVSAGFFQGTLTCLISSNRDI